jgi:hypothetical protein
MQLKPSPLCAAATPSCVESIHSVRKPNLFSALSDEQLPYQPLMAV